MLKNSSWRPPSRIRRIYVRSDSGNLTEPSQRIAQCLPNFPRKPSNLAGDVPTKVLSVAAVVFLCSLITLTRSSNTLATLLPLFDETSRKSQPNPAARARPWAYSTCLSSAKSLFVPTTMIDSISFRFFPVMNSPALFACAGVFRELTSSSSRRS